MSQVQPAVTRGDVARGAGLAALARLGAVVEALSQPLFVWLFGLPGYGIYVVLWGAINLVENIVDLSMTSALQRIVPTIDERDQPGAVRFALLVSVLPATAVAALAALNADALAGLLSAAPADRASLPDAIRLFAWALPLWTFIEVATSAARARRAFGPEIRLRIFWEQVARIIFALGFFLILGSGSIGLAAAHLCSLALTAALCLPLLARYYDLRSLSRAPIPPGLGRAMLLSGLGILPANLTRRLLIDAPPVVLNLMIPGTRGATAAGLFEIARKISTIPLIVRQAFQYVMAPLSSAQAHADRAELGPLYRFASRVSTALVVPLAAMLAFAGADILSVYRPEAAAALPLLTILVGIRALEAIVGAATPIVEMTGHRVLPFLNSALGVALWLGLTLWLVPQMGALGMAVSVAAATVLIAYLAVLELKLSDGLSPFDRNLGTGLAVALVGAGLMGLAEYLSGGPTRFVSVVTLWLATSWCALRFGLLRSDREALGPLARRLRLV